MTDKRYLAFAVDKHYPLGGMLDCVGSFDTLREAIEFVTPMELDFIHFYDRVEGINIDVPSPNKEA